MKKLFSVVTALLLVGFAVGYPVAHAKPTKPPGPPPGGAPLTMILIGGNDDPTSSDFANRMSASGWISPGANVVKITYPADVSQGEKSTADGNTAILAAYDQWCKGVNPCELHGASMGTNAVIRASHQRGVPCADPTTGPLCPPPNTKVVLHSSPNPVTGAWHSLNTQSFVDAFDRYSATFTVKEIPLPGTEHWYHQDDYVANKAPQCFNNVAISYMGAVFFAIHPQIQPKTGANDTWTGPDKVINHEFGASASPLTVSGNSPNKPTCPASGWYQ